MLIDDRNPMTALFEPFPTILEVATDLPNREHVMELLRREIIQPSYISRASIESGDTAPIFTFTCTFPLSVGLAVDHVAAGAHRGVFTLLSPCCAGAIDFNRKCRLCSTTAPYAPDAVTLYPGRQAVKQEDGKILDESNYGDFTTALERAFHRTLPQVDPLAVAMASMEFSSIFLNILEEMAKPAR